MWLSSKLVLWWITMPYVFISNSYNFSIYLISTEKKYKWKMSWYLCMWWIHSTCLLFRALSLVCNSFHHFFIFFFQILVHHQHHGVVVIVHAPQVKPGLVVHVLLLVNNTICSYSMALKIIHSVLFSFFCIFFSFIRLPIIVSFQSVFFALMWSDKCTNLFFLKQKKNNLTQVIKNLMKEKK